MDLHTDPLAAHPTLDETPSDDPVDSAGASDSAASPAAGGPSGGPSGDGSDRGETGEVSESSDTTKSPEVAPETPDAQPTDPYHSRMLQRYLHDYLVKGQLNETAAVFRRETGLSPEQLSAPIEVPRGFLLEWWSVFWELFAMRNQRDAAGVRAPLPAQLHQRNASDRLAVYEAAIVKHQQAVPEVPAAPAPTPPTHAAAAPKASPGGGLVDVAVLAANNPALMNSVVHQALASLNMTTKTKFTEEDRSTVLRKVKEIYLSTRHAHPQKGDAKPATANAARRGPPAFGPGEQGGHVRQSPYIVPTGPPAGPPMPHQTAPSPALHQMAPSGLGGYPIAGNAPPVTTAGAPTSRPDTTALVIKSIEQIVSGPFTRAQKVQHLLHINASVDPGGNPVLKREINMLILRLANELQSEMHSAPATGANFAASRPAEAPQRRGNAELGLTDAYGNPTGHGVYRDGAGGDMWQMQMLQQQQQQQMAMLARRQQQHLPQPQPQPIKPTGHFAQRPAGRSGSAGGAGHGPVLKQPPSGQSMPASPALVNVDPRFAFAPPATTGPGGNPSENARAEYFHAQQRMAQARAAHEPMDSMYMSAIAGRLSVSGGSTGPPGGAAAIGGHSDGERAMAELLSVHQQQQLLHLQQQQQHVPQPPKDAARLTPQQHAQLLWLQRHPEMLGQVQYASAAGKAPGRAPEAPAANAAGTPAPRKRKVQRAPSEAPPAAAPQAVAFDGRPQGSPAQGMPFGFAPGDGAPHEPAWPAARAPAKKAKGAKKAAAGDASPGARPARRAPDGPAPGGKRRAARAEMAGEDSGISLSGADHAAAKPAKATPLLGMNPIDDTSELLDSFFASLKAPLAPVQALVGIRGDSAPAAAGDTPPIFNPGHSVHSGHSGHPAAPGRMGSGDSPDNLDKEWEKYVDLGI